MNELTDSRVPSDLAGMDATLRNLHAEPRASLEPEIAGRFAAGERAKQGGRVRWVGPAAAAAVLLFVVAVARSGYVPLFDGVAATSTIDVCCQDLDGGGGADDGVLVETVRGTRVRRLVVYETQDHARAWVPGDVIRFMRRGAPQLHPWATSNGLIVRHFCCSDYDGGGHADDGLLVVASTAGEVLMAAVYERAGSTDRGVLR